jgi:hypothetical protein
MLKSCEQMKLNINRLIFPVFFLSFFSLWLVLILDIVFKYFSPQASLSSVSPLPGFSGLLFWLVAIVAAATSFSFGLEKLGILADLRKRIYCKDKGYEPEVFLAVPTSQPSWSSTKATGERGSLVEQASVSEVIVKATEPVIKPNKTAKQMKVQVKKAKKSFYLFGETKFEGCQHKFGYLGKHENKPIPDECFGCSRVIECFNSRS